MKNNIILIGMPSSGKSTLGVLLAKALGFSFVDTDLIISRRAGDNLQGILNSEGLDYFLALEEEVGSTLDCEYTVVATGGSMALSKRAMEHLGELGTVVFIDVPLEEIERRVTNITTRGIAFRPHETLADVYAQRLPLYQKYADLTVGTGGCIEETVERILSAVGKNS